MVEMIEASRLSPTANQGMFRPARKYSSVSLWRRLKVAEEDHGGQVEEKRSREAPQDQSQGCDHRLVLLEKPDHSYFRRTRRKFPLRILTISSSEYPRSSRPLTNCW